MTKAKGKYFAFLLLTLILSVPFYIWGAFFPVEGLPFGLPISFLMIFIPFFLSLIYAWKENGTKGVAFLFQSILDGKRAHSWSVIFCLVCMPLVAALAYVTMKALSFPLPTETVIHHKK